MTTTTPIPTAGVYRPRRYGETQIDPAITTAGLGVLLWPRSYIGGTVAAVDPRDAIAAGLAGWVAVLDVPEVEGWAMTAFDLDEAVFGLSLEDSATTVETLTVPKMAWPEAGSPMPEAGAVAEPSAYAAFKDLGRWLQAHDDEVADAVGVGRTTPYAWNRDGHEPRAATVRRLYEYHAVLSSLSRRLGSEEFRRWLFTGDPSRRERLLAGDLESLDQEVNDILFRRIDTGVDMAWAPEDREAAKPAAASDTLRPSTRRPRRARLP